MHKKKGRLVEGGCTNFRRGDVYEKPSSPATAGFA